MNYTPHDWDKPLWDVNEKVHNWRNYATDALVSEWDSLTERQKKVISECLQLIASDEEWE